MSNSPSAKESLSLVTSLQAKFVHGLEQIQGAAALKKSSWLRDGGRHGGGSRFSTGSNAVFNRASVNVSQVHYDDDPAKKLGSATALSTIIHPHNPHAPSLHMHISWTEMKSDDPAASRSGKGYWRMMADLNPSIKYEDNIQTFNQCLEATCPDQYQEAAAQGDRYFYIPALKRHRGVSHFYLENYKTPDPSKDRELAQKFGASVIECYLGVLEKALSSHHSVSDSDQATQLAYHTLYFVQVLTLDRGTTSGLLVHDQNDIGIMGSLPSHVNKSLLTSWRAQLPEPQERLLDGLIAALPDGDKSEVTTDVKGVLAKVVREHYRKFPEALKHQASGEVIPPTVENHRS